MPRFYSGKFLFVCVVFLFALSVQAQETSRVITNFDANWRFYQGDVEGAEKPEFNDAAWRKLNVPHDWSIEGENRESNPGGGTVGFFPTGIGWYRKAFNVEGVKADERYQIEFDGVYMNSSVWLNGKFVGNYHDIIHRTTYATLSGGLLRRT